MSSEQTHTHTHEYIQIDSQPTDRTYAIIRKPSAFSSFLFVIIVLSLLLRHVSCTVSVYCFLLYSIILLRPIDFCTSFRFPFIAPIFYHCHGIVATAAFAAVSLAGRLIDVTWCVQMHALFSVLSMLFAHSRTMKKKTRKKHGAKQKAYFDAKDRNHNAIIVLLFPQKHDIDGRKYPTRFDPTRINSI